MRASLVVVAVLAVALGLSTATLRKKPLCEMCENMVAKVDEVLAKGGDIEKAVEEFCRDDVPSFLIDYCEKIISKNLNYIIEKLKNHEPAEQICTDIYLCAA